MGYYLNRLKEFEQTDFKIWELLCSKEVDCIFDICDHTDFTNNNNNLSEEDAELLIDYIYDWVMSTEASPKEVSNIILDLLQDGSLTIDDFRYKLTKCRDRINDMF